ncbi:MAG TPA: dTMP kinase [Gammaproteobacteria bacterium]|nr:dTMP kinase [Gammaproteobacteria bacterium]
MSRNGLFITLEGGEGVGKSTQMSAVRNWLVGRGHEVVVTREPGGTPLAESVRDVVLGAEQEVPPLAELLLMFAARVSHVEKVIAPALAAGKTVLCDRFVDATYAYQGGARGLPAEQIDVLTSWLPAAAQPDLTVLIDVPVEVGLERARRRGEPDRFEKEKVQFFRRVRDAYLERARAFPHRFIVIEANRKPPRRVSAEIIERLADRLEGAAVD